MSATLRNCSSEAIKCWAAALIAACTAGRIGGKVRRGTLSASKTSGTLAAGTFAPSSNCCSKTWRARAQTFWRGKQLSRRTRKRRGSTSAKVGAGSTSLISRDSSTTSAMGSAPPVPQAAGSRWSQPLPATVSASGISRRWIKTSSSTTASTTDLKQRLAFKTVKGDVSRVMKCPIKCGTASSMSSVNLLTLDTTERISREKLASATRQRIRSLVSDCSWIFAASMSLAVMLPPSGAAFALAFPFALPAAFLSTGFGLVGAVSKARSSS
mmetsp:Transcript_29930/g.63727  ORF Transcript_29930/g.63727 Transcript_29930/m.63727 type:complete len:269 (+) Transcript_29930:291-1097(+)